MNLLRAFKRGRVEAGQHAGGSHARPGSAVLGFAGPQGLSLDAVLGDATGRGEHRYAPSMVAWMRQQYEVALIDAEDYHAQAQQALEGEQQSLVRAADIRYWLMGEAGARFDEAERLRNGGDVAPSAPGAAVAPADQRMDYTTVYAQQPLGLAEVRPEAPDGFDEDTPLYGHWLPDQETDPDTTSAQDADTALQPWFAAPGPGYAAGGFVQAGGAR